MLGDGGYPLENFLITPYRNIAGPGRRRFNKRLSNARVFIENAFGLLKVKWRRLQKLEFQSLEKIINLVQACCVLHNVGLLFDGGYELAINENEEGVEQQAFLVPNLPEGGVEGHGNYNNNQQATQKRDQLRLPFEI